MSKLESVSFSAMPMCGPLRPAYWSISWRNWASSPADLPGLCEHGRRAFDGSGYQCTITKSIAGPAMESTALFQSALSPLATTPSGQLPGSVSTAPILIVGSTAFIALTSCSRLLA